MPGGSKGVESGTDIYTFIFNRFYRTAIISNGGYRLYCFSLKIIWYCFLANGFCVDCLCGVVCCAFICGAGGVAWFSIAIYICRRG